MENLTNDLSEIKYRLNAIESRLGINQVAAPIPARPRPPIATTPVQNKSLSSGTLLGAFAVLCFVLAGVFLVKLAIDSGWLTPVRQFALTLISGAALIAVALGIRKWDRSYSGYLSAAGVIVLYLAAYGSTLFFHVLDPAQAMLLVGVIGLTNLFLWRKFENDFFCVTGAVGIYLGPLLLGRFGNDLISVSAYYILWSTVFSLISVNTCSRVLSIVASYCAFGAIGLVGFFLRDQDQLRILLLTQTIQFFLYAGLTVYYSLKNDSPISVSEAAGYLPVLLFFYGSEYWLLNQVIPEIAPWLSLGFGAALILFYFSAKQRFSEINLPSAQLILSFGALAVFHSLYLEILTDSSRPWLMVAFLFVATFFSRSLGNKLSIVTGVVAVIVSIEIFKLLWNMWGNPEFPTVMIAMVVAALFLLNHGLKRNEFKGQMAEVGYLILGVAHILVIQTLYVFTHGLGSLWVSGSWALYAILILIYSFKIQDSILARSSVVVLTVAAGKVLLYDMLASDAFVRILCLALTGALLYFAGFLFRQIKQFS